MSINKEQQIIELEQEMEEAELIVQRGKDLAKLKTMPEFKSVFIDGYIGEMAEFLFAELTKSITLQSQPEDQLREGLLAIRHLKSYIGFDGLKGDIEYNAERAAGRLGEIQDMLDKI